MLTQLGHGSSTCGPRHTGPFRGATVICRSSHVEGLFEMDVRRHDVRPPSFCLSNETHLFETNSFFYREFRCQTLPHISQKKKTRGGGGHSAEMQKKNTQI